MTSVTSTTSVTSLTSVTSNFVYDVADFAAIVAKFLCDFADVAEKETWTQIILRTAWVKLGTLSFSLVLCGHTFQVQDHWK